MSATYQKLNSGEWGIRVQGTVTRGDEVTVMRKDGQSRREVVKKVIWSGNGICLCAIEQRANGGGGYSGSGLDGHRCRNGHGPHSGPCCSGRHGAGYDCGADCCELD